MKNLHIIPYEKFTKAYIDFINLNFSSSEHYFAIVGAADYESCDSNVIIVEKTIKSYLSLILNCYKSDKIFLHSLFFTNIVKLLSFQPWLLKKCYWIIWGADLYSYRSPRSRLSEKFNEIFRSFSIKRFAGLITHIKGDYELAKKWYGAKGKHHYSFVYPSNLYKDIEISHEFNNRKLFIQVGNSADPSNNHIEILNKLKALNRNDIQIIVPLSYGNKEYAKKVIKVGTKMFRENFTPMKDFMPLNEYIQLLSKIDIAIFNHDRQQALGNITTLIGMGKTIYMKSDITSTEFLRSMGIQLFDVETIEKDLSVLSEKAIQYNKNIIKNRFSPEELVKDLKKIFQ